MYCSSHQSEFSHVTKPFSLAIWSHRQVPLVVRVVLGVVPQGDVIFIEYMRQAERVAGFRRDGRAPDFRVEIGTEERSCGGPSALRTPGRGLVAAVGPEVQHVALLTTKLYSTKGKSSQPPPSRRICRPGTLDLAKKAMKLVSVCGAMQYRLGSDSAGGKCDSRNANWLQKKWASNQSSGKQSESESARPSASRSTASRKPGRFSGQRWVPAKRRSASKSSRPVRA